MPCVHTDLTDEDQQVKLTPPAIGAELVDTVSYTGLVPGKEYRMSLTLMDKATGKDASAAKQEAQQKAPASVTQTSGTETASSNSSSTSATSSTGESSPSSSSGSSTQAHQHTWVAQTEHHSAQYETVHHNAVYKDVQVCSDCGAISPSDSHIYEHMVASEDAKGGTYGKSIKVHKMPTTRRSSCRPPTTKLPIVAPPAERRSKF